MDPEEGPGRNKALASRLQRWFDEYADYHRHPMNRLAHKIAIPAIVFHILVMLDWIDIVPLGAFAGSYQLSLGHLFFAGTLVWYFTLSAKLAFLSMLLFTPLFAIGVVTPPWVVVDIAVVAWTIQLAGHVIWEKRSPAFATNLLQALIGPLFFLALFTGDWRDSGPAATSAIPAAGGPG